MNMQFFNTFDIKCHLGSESDIMVMEREGSLALASGDEASSEWAS